MKRIRKYRGWGIYQNNPKEIEEFGFNITVLSPPDMDYPYLCSPRDTDMEMNTVEDAISWIDNFKED